MRTPGVVRRDARRWWLAIEPVAAAVLLAWWLLGPAQPIASLSVVPMRTETTLTNVYAVLIAVAFAVALAISRLSPFLTLALVAVALGAQLVGWAARFSQTGWAAYLILLAVVLALSGHARGRVRVAAIVAALPMAAGISALLNFPSLSLSGQWGIINGMGWGSPDVLWGFVIWTVAQLIVTAGLWWLPAWLRSLRRTPTSAVETTAAIPAALSRREQEVYLMVARGMTNAEIGAAAHVEESTVKTHISNILAKLELSSRTAVIAHAYRTGVLVPEAATPAR